MTSHPTTPTLDADRTARLRAFLTEEARADLAAAPPRTTDAAAAAAPAGDHATVRPLRTRPRVPRLAIAAAAVVLLAAGGLVASSFVRGGPAGSPAAVAFQDEGDGWTRITLTDVAADADQVVAELRAKGFDARLRTMSPTSVGTDGGTEVAIEGDSSFGFAMAQDAGADGRGRIGLSVDFPDEAAPALATVLPFAPSTLEDSEAVLEEIGVRLTPQNTTTIDVRDGADVTIAVLVFT